MVDMSITTTTQTVSCRLSHTLYGKLEEDATANGLTVSSHLATLVTKLLAESGSELNGKPMTRLEKRVVDNHLANLERDDAMTRVEGGLADLRESVSALGEAVLTLAEHKEPRH